MKKYVLALFLSVLFFQLPAQVLVIPANTGYAVPAELDGHSLFKEKNGIHWQNPKQKISYFFYAAKPGMINLSFLAKSTQLPVNIQLQFTARSRNVQVPVSKTFQTIHAGTIYVLKAGFYELIFKAITPSAKMELDIASLQFSGSAVEGMQVNVKERRNAASVHLSFPVADTMKSIAFYNEVTVPDSADHLYSFYMGAGFRRGYFGIQVNSQQERRVIFSVWDAGNESMDRNKVPDSNRVVLLAKGAGVVANDFGNEGTGGHSHFVYPWKTNTSYPMLVTAVPDSASVSTIYTGYIYLPEEGKWKLIASFLAPRDGQYLQRLHAFNENFVGANGQLKRKAFFTNPWIQRSNGAWKPLTSAQFSTDATGIARDRIDIGAGVIQEKFYLWNGGFEPSNAAVGAVFQRKETGTAPLINLSNHLDSAVQAMKDKELIVEAVKKGKIDTTGYVDGIYYKVLAKGTGKPIGIKDTLSVFYKGALLSDQSIFDQTKEKPITFPLSRLIKGWQIGLPMINHGGKIILYIPSGLAYGIRTRSKRIPVNSILEFTIEVL